MKIGITFDLKEEPASGGRKPPGLPDDLQEEFDSPVTIEAIASVLRDLGHEVVKLGDGRELLRQLLADPPDFVFNFAEGQGVGRSREARVPAVLEMLGIPYSGSDPLTLAVTLDKDCAKRLVASAGVPVPKAEVWKEGWKDGRMEEIAGVARSHSSILPSFHPSRLTYPVIIKPAWEGSSKGIRNHCVVDEPAELPRMVEKMQRDYGQPVLVEEFIQGDELTVGVIGNAPPRILGVMRVLPTQPGGRFVYGVEVKRDYQRLVRYESPPALPAGVLARLEKAALDSYRILGCLDVARVDFRLRDGVPYFLEVNPLPGLHPKHSDLVILAKLCGWTYPGLIQAILQAARERYSM